MLDEYLWGDATRLSAEAPVPVVEVRQRTLAPGGAGNAAANVVSLGGVALLGGVVGDDDAGRRLREILHAAGIEGRGLLTDSGRPRPSCASGWRQGTARRLTDEECTEWP